VATVARSIAPSASPLPWLGQFLKDELAPYPGRAGLVARMVLATTIVMVVCMTFRLSYGFQGAVIALLTSRENPRTTLQSAWAMLLSTAIGALYLLVSAWFVISNPMLHLLWVMGSFFLTFYVLSALNNYVAAAIFSATIAVGVPLWDRYVSAETNVEDILRLVLVTMVGAAATLAVEFTFVHRKPGESIVEPVAERLAAVEGMLDCMADGRPVDDAMAANITRLGMVGTSRLRRILRLSGYSSHFAEQMGAVVGLSGGIVDIAANLSLPDSPLSEDDRRRIRRLAKNIAAIRGDLLAGKTPHLTEPTPDGNLPSAVSSLPEMERIVSLIAESFVGSQPLDAFASLASSGDPPQKLFAWDSQSSEEHIKFALKGCLTASLCYIIYNAIDWQGISTCVTTCFLTALTTIGASRQKQALRFAGAVVGGFVIGMGSQIFILPYVNSIGGFTVLFILVTALSAWVMASSTRLSYFGFQAGFTYYLINLQEFAFQPSLAIARDRVVGVLFGLIMMWSIFDQLWGAPALVAMKQAFVADLRLLAQLAREPASADRRVATSRYFSLREAIGKNFDNVRSLGDGVLLEFGATREEGLIWRRRIRQWQPQLRTFFLTQVNLWKYRAQLPGFELPEPVRAAQVEFDNQSAKALDGIADRIEGKPPAPKAELEKSLEHLDQVIQTFRSENPQEAAAPQIQAFLPLPRRIEILTTSLDQQI
jgi:multidrug resistance protein MdtO